MIYSKIFMISWCQIIKYWDKSREKERIKTIKLTTTTTTKEWSCQDKQSVRKKRER